jgi:DNA-binding CsgD family transcriptional regulator/tetratricopeptide (TPR) repeat protein
VGLAEQAEPELERADQAQWTRTLANELENLRGALAWAYKTTSALALLRLAAALGNFWRWHGDLREGREWLSRALLTAQPGNESLLSKAQRRAARIYGTLGEREQALLLYGSARKNAEAANDLAGVAESLVSTGGVMIEDGRPAEAEPLVDEGLELARTGGYRAVLAGALLQKGILKHYMGELEAARHLYAEAAELAQSLGDSRLAAVALVNSADTKMVERDYEGAIELASLGAGHLEACGDMAYSPWAHLLLGLAHRRLDRMEISKRATRIGASQALETASPVDLIFAAETMADWLGAAGQSRAAVSLWAASTAARQTLDFPRQPWDDAWINEGIDRDRSALPSEGAAEAWNTGVETGLAEAVADGVGTLDKTSLRPSGGGRGVRKGDKRALTSRESAVLDLLGQGRSTQEIAESLSITQGTASAHVSNIKWKLGADSRVEIVTTAIRKGLIELSPEQ